MSLKTSVLKNETCIQNGKLLLNLAMDTRFILAGETFRVADTDPGNISKSFSINIWPYNQLHTKQVLTSMIKQWYESTGIYVKNDVYHWKQIWLLNGGFGSVFYVGRFRLQMIRIRQKGSMDPPKNGPDRLKLSGSVKKTYLDPPKIWSGSATLETCTYCIWIGFCLSLVLEGSRIEHN